MTVFVTELLILLLCQWVLQHPEIHARYATAKCHEIFGPSISFVGWDVGGGGIQIDYDRCLSLTVSSMMLGGFIGYSVGRMILPW